MPVKHSNTPEIVSKFLSRYRGEETTVPWFQDGGRAGDAASKDNAAGTSAFIPMSDPRSTHARAYGRAETAYPNNTREFLDQDMKIREGAICAAVAVALGLLIGLFAGFSVQAGANTAELAETNAHVESLQEQLDALEEENEQLAAELAPLKAAAEEAAVAEAEVIEALE